MIRRIAASLALLCLVTALAANPQAGPKPERLAVPAEISLPGWYSVAGEIPGASTYTGVVLIAKQGEGFRFHWLLQDGSRADGIGLRDGDTLSVAATPMLICRFSIAAVDGKPMLRGRFAGPGGGTGTETLTWLRAVE